MKIKAAAVSAENSSILRLISVINHTVFAIFHIGVNLYVVVGGIPAVQLFLCRCGPEHCAVKHTAVLKAVRQTADVNAASLSKGIYCHLYFFVLLDQDLCIRKCKGCSFCPLQNPLLRYSPSG